MLTGEILIMVETSKC